jgi:hypothetical protein
MANFELNNIRKDADYTSGKINSRSPVVEVFSRMAKGMDVGTVKAADQAVEYIKGLGTKAMNGDATAAAELNEMRRFVIEPLLLEEAKLLGIFGSYQALAYGDSIEREVSVLAGEKSRIQAPNGDVTFPSWVRDTYTVPSVTISGGYAVDYRAVSLGDMQKENVGMEQVRTDIRNQAALYVVKKLYAAIKAATGVKFWAEGAGIAQASLDRIVNGVRRFGPTSILGSYAAVSQVNAFVGWTNGVSFGISDPAMEEIRKDGLVGMYKGSIVRELANPFNLTETRVVSTIKEFVPLMPDGLLFVLPTGGKSPVMTWTRGGLTSMTGNDISTGKVLTRFDLEVAADVAKGHEHEIGLINDTNLSSAASYAI